MKMRVFSPLDNVSRAAEAVAEFGFMAVDGTASTAEFFCSRVTQALAPYDEIIPITAYQNVTHRGNVYLVLDTARFPLDQRSILKKKVAELDRMDPG